MGLPTSSQLAARQARARQHLDTLSLDALVVTCASNVRYLSNHAGSSGVLVLTRESVHLLVGAMNDAAAALRDAEIEFMLGGGLAAWARGGPPTDHDVDFYVREEHAERGLEALASAGMRTERPPDQA